VAPISVPPAARGTVLLADNEPFILTLGRAILTREGYRVVEARDGREAVEAYRRVGGAISLVVLDQAMPGLSGPAALAALRALDPAVRVLLVSGGPPDDLPPEVRAALRGYLAKPFSRDQLLRAVESALAPEPNDGPAGG
jgi:CheY-like chemotaxis protein